MQLVVWQHDKQFKIRWKRVCLTIATIYPHKWHIIIFNRSIDYDTHPKPLPSSLIVQLEIETKLSPTLIC